MQKPRIEFSKWLKLHALLDTSEMEELIVIYGEPLPIGRIVKDEQPFSKAYAAYIEGLKQGEVIPLLPYAWTDVPEIRPSRPVIHLIPHQFAYSKIDKKFRSMVKGISWGFQFSYPQVYQEGNEIVQVESTKPFLELQRWMRKHTHPCTFEVDGKRTRTPIRLGNKCDWIHQYLTGEIRCVLK